MSHSGILVDLCRSCYGIWLDKGEIYNYSKDPKRLQGILAETLQTTSPSARACPRCQKPLSRAKAPSSDLELDACPTCGGLWFDEGEIQRLNRIVDSRVSSRELPFQDLAGMASIVAPPVPSMAPPSAPAEPMRPPDMFPPINPMPKIVLEPAQERPATGTGVRGFLSPLPNFAFRSGIVMVSLYGILSVFIFILLVALKMPSSWVWMATAVTVLMNFIFAPILMDLTLRWAYKFSWVEPQALPSHLSRFIASVCDKNGVPFPRCGIIEDGNPNAFTYGHYPGNSRLVLTRGLLNILDEEELEAVAGHELGHMFHWDILIMVAAALVPALFYFFYRQFSNLAKRSSKTRGKKGNPAALFFLIAILSYLLYQGTEYVVFYLSRLREYYADRFSGETTGKPNKLAAALIKIAYGLAGQREQTGDEEGQEGKGVGMVRTLGIVDPIGAKGLVAASLVSGFRVPVSNILGAMQWDLWNPWAAYFELNSTHPLPAKRLQRLGEQAESLGQVPLVSFNLEKPESYWDEFLVDVFILFLPWLLPVAAAASYALNKGSLTSLNVFGLVLCTWSIGYAFKLFFSYPARFFPETAISSLLKKVKVSRVRGVPAVISGKVIGRGIPGFLLSSDMVVQDSTGFLFIDYEQPLALFNWIFALRTLPNMIGEEVTLRGWYRRGPVPFLELRSVSSGYVERKCWVLEAKVIFAILAFLASIALMVFY